MWAELDDAAARDDAATEGDMHGHVRSAGKNMANWDDATSRQKIGTGGG